ncbi:putative antibiotic biosynthesis protein [Phaeoacremonium minimum UCRPA7]|uniref:Putative antibiotic biosynthesis protein n=1 Tax=Phaeoacremonium minimum (strain UCR-PA7) TaxID=1286976 RepID=R8BIM7_PHAM7|nr:putative antibiotic biosynthesis protein [Phaeoacremonium minimum UCRPA7]EON99183.1 putative antibiotic biosynthesis protein [Phaeoacremonium minimum UCRPA7]
MAESTPYFAVSTLQVAPENMEKVVEFFTKVGKETEAKEPAAKIYRWFKTEGKNEFVFIEKFDSLEDYRAHQRSDHVQGLYAEYKKYLPEPFVFHFMDLQGVGPGGFDRS